MQSSAFCCVAMGKSILQTSVSPLKRWVGARTGSFCLCCCRASAWTQERRLLQCPCGEPKGAAWGDSALGWAWGAHEDSPPLSGQIVKKSCYPRWNETFEFELEEGATEALCVEAWDWDLVSRNDFLGRVSTLPLQAVPATFCAHPPIPPLQLPQRGALKGPRTPRTSKYPIPNCPWCSGTFQGYSSWQGRDLSGSSVAQHPACPLPPGGGQCPETVGRPAGGLVPAAARSVQEPEGRVSAWNLVAGTVGSGPGGGWGGVPAGRDPM